MIKSERELRVILIGGPSHAGKSILAQSLGLKLGWTHISTDSLARHPGRPWRKKLETVPENVAEHYLSLSGDELFADVLSHYKNMWPDIETIVTSHATDPSTQRLIIEGSALWPESMATLDFDKVAAIWLTASNDLLLTRIHDESQFEAASAKEKKMIQNFLDRTLIYKERMMDAVNRLGLASMEVEATSSLEDLSGELLELINFNPEP